jgi:hypothetical protein
MECFLCGENTGSLEEDLCVACMERGEEEVAAGGITSQDLMEFSEEF